MSLRLSLVFASLLFLSACGKPAPADAPPTPSPAADTTAATAATATPPGCVSKEVAAALGGLNPDLARSHDGSVELCGDLGDARRCVVTGLDGERTLLSVADDDLERLPEYPAGFSDGFIRDDARGTLRVCVSAAVGCKDLYVGQTLAARFDLARERAVVTTLDDGKQARLFEVATQTQTAALDLAEDTLPDCSFAAFVGNSGHERLLVSSGPCSSGGRSWLADPQTGAKIAEVGGDRPIFVRDGHAVPAPQAGPNAWAFRSADGAALVVQDVVEGRVLGRLELRAAVGETTPKHDGAWLLSHPQGLVLVEARPLPGSIYVVDAKRLEVTQALLPRLCE